MKRKIKLHLVGQDPADIFNDLEKLKADSTAPASRRARATETFARIPHDWARKLFRHIGGPAWMLLIEIDRLILKDSGRNPVKLTTDALQGSGLTRWEKERGLRLLEQAGVITVERKRGRCPLITHLLYPVKI